MLVDQMIAQAPELIVVAGDIFHSPNPGNAAIVHAVGEFMRVRIALPDTPIVLVSGNHDDAKFGNRVDLVPMFARLGIHVADRTAERFHFPALDCSVLAVPDVLGVVRPALTPDPCARFNVLVLHGSVQGMPSETRHGRETEILDEEMHTPQWSYVALGHYHEYHRIAPNCYYSGSIDWTSSNPWKEIGTSKGFVMQDLVTGEHALHALPVVCRYVNLDAIDGYGMSSAELDVAIAAEVDAAVIDDMAVRLVVHNITRETEQGLDGRALRKYKARALAFILDGRRPEIVRIGVDAGSSPALYDHAAETAAMNAEMATLWGDDPPSAPDIEYSDDAFVGHARDLIASATSDCDPYGLDAIDRTHQPKVA